MSKANHAKKTALNGHTSIRRQLTIISVAIMAVTIAACILVNTFFLEKYYVHNKEKEILNVYSLLSEESSAGNISSEEFDLTLQRTSSTHNVSVVIISSVLEPIKVYGNEPQDQLLTELQLNLMSTIQAERIFEKTDDYILIQRKDNRMQTDFLEMWGSLPDGSFFLLRTALESIALSASIATRFLLYIGLGAIVISGIVIYILSRRFSKPILELAEISEKMSEMDFNAKYEGKEKNEIGVLGNSINKMSSNLEMAISELKEANEQLKKDNELKTQIDEMRKEFISNVSHELKTPIALIQGYAEGLKEGVNDAEDRDYYCDVIMDESAKMNIMVKKLLTLNQLESGADILQKEEFDLSALIKNYVQSSEILTSAKEVKVNLKVDDECMVVADEFKIEEVLMNFFSNALNHCEGEKEIDVTLSKGDNEVTVTVFNTGKQIPAESIDRIWEKFYKVDKARTRAYGGSGVGLSIVKAIMEAHGGRYGVENKENGVSFFFTLPL